MAVVTVGDMLDKAQAFERELERFYADIRDRTTDNGVRLLTYYLARRKRHLPGVLNECPPAQIETIRRTPFKYDDADFAVEKYFEGTTLSADAGADMVLMAAIGFVEVLIGFYRRLSEQPLGADAEGLFQSLLKIEEKDVIELKKIRATHYF